MSQKNLYIATWVRWEDWNFWNWDNTQIVKFWLENLELEKIWKVKWRILNQFSMDEFDWNFRIATTKNDSFVRIKDSDFEESKKEEWWNNLFILNKDFKEVWKIEWIAKWEQIKSVRFMWNRAFIVTFKNMDPFFVLDLKNPKNPKVLWELKIPGWSDYLHPFWENYILWFWKDAKAVWKWENLRWNDVWWVKISLFDITDLKNRKEKFSYKVKAELLNNKLAIKPGFTGLAEFLLENKKHTLSIKEKNIIYKGNRSFVEIVKNKDIITKVEIIRGISDGIYTEIKKGIKKGDRIVSQ